MSWSKINQFHWHVVDSQSFALQVPGFMELSQKAAYTPSSVYSPSDVSDIVSYAAERGIDVLVEVDTPGHTAAISKSHPEHIACNEASPWTSFANGMGLENFKVFRVMINVLPYRTTRWTTSTCFSGNDNLYRKSSYRCSKDVPLHALQHGWG